MGPIPSWLDKEVVSSGGWLYKGLPGLKAQKDSSERKMTSPKKNVEIAQEYGRNGRAITEEQ